MYIIKSIIISILFGILFSGCFSANLNILKVDELDKKVASEKGINNFKGNILDLTVEPNVENVFVVLPKEDMTVRVKIKIANIEDVLYMNIIDDSDFKINKILKRVSNLDELSLNQDGWMFEPSIEKGVITLQLYLPAIYLYSTKYNPKLLFSYKRSSRAVQDSIQFHFIREQYYPSQDKDGHEIPVYTDLADYCQTTGKDVSPTYLEQIDRLNSNRVDQNLKDKLRGLCN